MPDPREESDYAALRARYQGVIDAAVDGIVIIDERGTVETFSAAAERIFGYRAGEVVGRNVSMLMPEPDASAHDGYLANYLGGGPPRIIGIGREVVGRRRDGELFPMDLSVGEVAGQRPRRFVGMVRDVTERHRAEDETREARERLAQVGRVTTLGEMASAIAHEINQPLTAISAYAQAARRLIDRGAADEATLRETLEAVAAQAIRAGDVVKRIRAFVSHRDTGRERHALNDIVRAVLGLAEVDARSHRVRIETHLAPGLPEVLVDEVQIQQVCLNLVRNAIDAMLAQPEAERRLVITTAAAAGRVTACFEDNGPGVSPAMQAHLFEPFQTTKDDGMGMGLSISHSIIAAHDGTLTLETDRARGAAFTLALPGAPA